MSVGPLWFLTGLALPAAIAAAVMLLALRPWRGAACGLRRTGVGWALAIGLGMAVGIPAMHGLPAGDAWNDPLALFEWHRWLWLALPVMTVGAVLVAAQTRGARLLGAGLGVLLAAALPLFELMPIVRHEWATAQAASWLIPLSMGMLALAGLGHGLSTRVGRELPPIVGLTAVGAGLTIAFSGSESTGLTLVSLGAVMAGGGTAALFGSCRSAYGSASPAVLVLAAVLLAGYFYTYDPYTGTPGLLGWHAIVLALAPLLAFVGSVPLPTRLDRPVVRAAIRLVLALAPVAVVAIDAGLTFAREYGETSSPY